MISKAAHRAAATLRLQDSGYSAENGFLTSEAI